MRLLHLLLGECSLRRASLRRRLRRPLLAQPRNVPLRPTGDLAALRRAAQQSYARRAALLRAGQRPPPAADEAARRAREEYNRRMLGSVTAASRGEAGAGGADQSLPDGERPSVRRAPMSLQELEALAGLNPQ